MIPTPTPFLSLANSNGNPLVDSGLLGGTCNSISLNILKLGCVTTLFICNSITCRPSCVFYCYCCKCCSKCYKCCSQCYKVSIQSSYTFPSKCKCSSPIGNLVSCSSLTSCLYSLNCLTCGNVICGTSYFCSLSCLSYGHVICDVLQYV
jgi:hypothetical protein